MVNGNYVLYGDRPSSESETVDDHVQTRTAERKTKRKSSRIPKDTAKNQYSHNHKITDIDNETDAVKYEKKIKEPRLLRYVPTTDVEQNYITEKFETYDLKPTEELPRRHAFTKKPKNPADGSVNYAYSRSSSSCSSPNLPTISEHGEQYGTYRVRSPQPSPINNPVTGYETKLDKYFAKPREVKTFTAKGSHPDSLYRVSSDSGTGADKFMRALRLLRWPLALFTVCVALAVFVYFLMPVNTSADTDTVNATYWEENVSQAQSHRITDENQKLVQNKGTEKSRPRGTKTPEIDFYDADNGQNSDLTTLIDIITERSQKRKLPVPPVFPTHISPEVQYGNERVDSDKTRSPKLLKDTTTVTSDSTLKPHITQKPEKPLAIYFKDGNGVTATSTEAVPVTENFANAETSNDINAYLKQQTRKGSSTKSEVQINEVPSTPLPVYERPKHIKQNHNAERILPPEIQEFYDRPVIDNDVKFTSGHSKLFGISIEDAENMKATTQNSLYNTRVSPTLPTWRNREDATTKKYPINGNYDVPQCRSTRLPLCRGVLPYDLATGPAFVGDVDVTTLLPQIEYLVSTNCSQRVRHFACALLEPECSPPPYSQKLPCYNFCKAIVDHCESLIPRELQAMFSCSQYSSNNCASARAPCFARELACGDGTCVPRDWICDGTRDCAGGEDEAPCSKCDVSEYRCASGMCITKRWLCDGYADCPSGEDEHEELCQGRRIVNLPRDEDIDEPGEESAGSAPAPSVRKPNRLPIYRNGENDNSKELLMTSDSNNAFRRNFTRRPSPSRLSPYKRPKPPANFTPDPDELTVQTTLKSSLAKTARTPKPSMNNENAKQNEDKQDSSEDINIGDLGLFEDIEKIKTDDKEKSNDKDSEEKEKSDENGKSEKKHVPRQNVRKQVNRVKSTDSPPASPAPTRLDKRLNKLERASLLRKAAQSQREEIQDSPESNSTVFDNTEELASSGYNSAHASPCPSGELRCVDGRCITLAQLCDGTVDCSDHADEDNCYT
ncbi:uncharacterized protein LOC123875724 isoform X1 [Maniola jurtina]|uniref:uncharacterized protein LOC123875724 isoform X1 n=1 Tax=Maniola jurtina TaxID=191418 RepID=UPI001E689E4A|nr:uncharacterized protein LOC123875724 isoform X1 [Maniola jurtina]